MLDATLVHYRTESAEMKLHILSDLHTEFADFDPPRTDADIVVLAGDIGVGTGGVEWAKQWFPDVPVLYVPGNHEYYGHDIHETDLLAAVSSPNIQILDNNSYVIDAVRFLGMTLWTDFLLYGEGECQAQAEKSCDCVIELKPQDYIAYYTRAGLRPWTSYKNHIQEMESLLWDTDKFNSGAPVTMHASADSM